MDTEEMIEAVTDAAIEYADRPSHKNHVALTIAQRDLKSEITRLTARITELESLLEIVRQDDIKKSRENR
jgi:hypothetical protein